MIRVQFRSNSLAPNSSSCISSSSSPSDHISIGSARILFLHPKLQAPISLCSKNHNCSKPLLRSCKASLGRRHADGKDVSDDDGFLQASLLVSVEGHDPLADEIDMIKKIKTAVLEERYEDAAMWRDKLANLRMQSHGTVDET